MAACGYCENVSRESQLQCVACSRWFCNSTHGTTRSHVLVHIRESGHHEFRTAAGARVACSLCEEEKNVFQLGGRVSGDPGGHVQFRCRSGCGEDSPPLTESELNRWPPLVAGDLVQPWLATHTSYQNPRMFQDAAEELEKLWRRGQKHATLVDVQQFNRGKSSGGNGRAGASRLETAPDRFREFQSKKTYRTFFEELLEQERLTCLLEDNKNLVNVASCLWDYIEQFAELKLHINPKRLGPGIEVQLILEGNQPWSAIGKVLYVKAGKLTTVHVGFNTDEAARFPSDVTSGFRLRPDAWSEVTFDRMKAALEKLSQDPGLDWLSTSLIEKTLLPKSSRTVSPEILIDATDMNASQVAALQVATSTAVSLIQGPPGTGKTTVSVRLVEALASEGTVLVCAPSNVVTNHLAAKLAEYSALDVVRVVARSREELEVNLSVALHKLCEDEWNEYADARRKLKALQKRGDDPEEIRRLSKICLAFENARLDKANVIVTTCIGAGDARVVKRRFTSVIIDEATQTVEPACLVPAVLSTGRLVLVGDQQQLGPVVIDNRAHVQGLGTSLFQRLVLSGIPRTRLDIQYRMHPEIARFPSEAFYDGTLLNGVSAMSRVFRASFVPWLYSNGQSLPCFFWHIPAEEEWDSRGRSQINRVEALRVVELVKTLDQSPDQVGVITFYDGQRTLLTGALKDSCEIASVDGFQGREKDVIILSTVRANSKGRIGFLDDFRRLNVAITRAKRALAICGNVKTIRASNDATWRQFLNHLDERGAIFQGASITNLQPVSLTSAQ